MKRTLWQPLTVGLAAVLLALPAYAENTQAPEMAAAPAAQTTTVAEAAPTVEEMNAAGKKVALAQFSYISPLPANTREVLNKYKNVIVAELNTGQFADYLQSKVDGLVVKRINKTQGQPFLVHEIVEGVTKIMEGK